MHAQMRRRKRVLRRLGHCDSEGVIQLKGRVACEINTCDELVVTELIFCGAFTELSPEQSASLLSCMVHQVSFVRVLCARTTRRHAVAHARTGLRHILFRMRSFAAITFEDYAQ